MKIFKTLLIVFALWSHLASSVPNSSSFDALIALRDLYLEEVPNSSYSDVLIAIAPIGEKPLVFRSDKESVLCRRGYPTHDYGLELEKIEEINFRREDSDLGDNSESEEEIVSEIFEDVSEGWFKIGLNFSNNSDYYLVVENLEFMISAAGGEEQLYGTKTLASGIYCESDPLYIVPPKSKVIYNPDRSHSMGNLQLYVDEIPLPLVNSSLIPSYRVELLVNGHFSNQSESDIGSFSRKLIFQTLASKWNSVSKYK